MARNTKKKQVTAEDDGKQLFAAIDQLEQEKGIKPGYMMEKISQALVAAYRHDHPGVGDKGDNVQVKIDREAGTFKMLVLREVVETVDNPDTEISQEDAMARVGRAVGLGDIIKCEVMTKNFGRVAAGTARQVIVQGIREAEQDMVYNEFANHENEILTGVVTRLDAHSGHAIAVSLGSGHSGTVAFLSDKEQVAGEVYHEGQRLKVYVVRVMKNNHGSQVQISRTHPGLVKRLFELEVPEIQDGTVQIRSIAREAGSRTKLAVYSTDPNVDPIGACVGTRGARVNRIVNELNNEKIDIIKYSDEPTEYIRAALAPAEVEEVSVPDENKCCRVKVRADQLSLAIGKEGQNARLAAKLTGYKIDIKDKDAPDEPEEPEEPEESEESEEPGQSAEEQPSGL